LLPLTTFLQARSKLGLEARQLATAIAPGLLASLAMAAVVWLLGRQLGPTAPWQRLSLEVAFGGACYVSLLAVFSRSTLAEVAGLIVRRQGPSAAGASA
jgi:hypothetical protein